MLRLSALLGATAVALTAPAALAAPAPSALQRIESAFDQQAVALTFATPPRYSVERVSDTHFVVWLENVQLAPNVARTGTVGFHAWALEPAAGGLARLELMLTGPGAPVVALDGKRLVVLPQLASEATVAPDGVTTILGRAGYDSSLDAWVVPYYGRPPQVAVSAAGPTAVQVDVANAAVTPSGVQLTRTDEHPLVGSWSLTRLPETAISRFLLSFRYPAGVTVRVDEALSRLVITPVLGEAAALPFVGRPVSSLELADRKRPATPWLTAAPLIKPAAVRPSGKGEPTRLVIEVPAGQPIPQIYTTPGGPLRPLPLPAAPTTATATGAAPATVTSTPAAAVPLPLVRRVALEARQEWTSEALIAGAIDFGPSLVPAIGLSTRYDLDASWSVGGAFTYRDYTLADSGTPDSRHHRDDFVLEAHSAYRFPQGAWQPFLGLGYYGRQVSVASNVAPSLSRPLVFAPTQIFHGPVLLGGAEGQVSEALRWGMTLSVRPYLFTGGHETVTALGGMFGYGARPAVSYTWNGLEASLGYQLDWMTAYTNDFTHLKHGPFVDAAWRF